MTGRVAAVVIGRNEGERLQRCLKSLENKVEHIVYVDSGSTDGSLVIAKAAGAEPVALDMATPFTAARARNAGAERLAAFDYIQFVDGDCEVQQGWIATAAAHLDKHQDIAVVCGRRRERFPDTSVYNRLIDIEWDTPIGAARACGGDALMRRSAFEAAGGFNPSLIAGEEPELCVRLRKAGWKIWRLDAEMTLHDAAMTTLGQWWTRTRRAGHAYAEGAALHGAPPERHNVVPLRRALVWGALLPIAALAGAMITPFALLLLLAHPAQILRLVLRGEPLVRAVFLTIGKFAEAQGALGYYVARVRGQQREVIEYK